MTCSSSGTAIKIDILFKQFLFENENVNCTKCLFDQQPSKQLTSMLLWIIIVITAVIIIG